MSRKRHKSYLSSLFLLCPAFVFSRARIQLRRRGEITSQSLLPTVPGSTLNPTFSPARCASGACLPLSSWMTNRSKRGSNSSFRHSGCGCFLYGAALLTATSQRQQHLLHGANTQRPIQQSCLSHKPLQIMSAGGLGCVLVRFFTPWTGLMFYYITHCLNAVHSQTQAGTEPSVLLTDNKSW